MTTPASVDRQPQCTVSIVSHGHDAWVAQLLQDIARTAGAFVTQVIVTHNLPPSQTWRTGQAWPFVLTERVNGTPAGFATNHNRALAGAATPLLCILNPDITLPDPHIWSQLAEHARQPGAGLVFPVLVNPDGSVQDNVRSVPTPWALFLRRVLGRRAEPMDWVSAAFWVVSTSAFQQLRGLDERYFLYCEDVDFCLRLQLAGWRLVATPAQAAHHAHRSSHRRWQHLRWHLASLLRLWCSRVLRDYLRLRRTRPD